MYDLARGLVQRGNRVSVFTSDALDVKETGKRINLPQETLEGIEITRFPRIGPGLPSKFLRVIVKGFKRELQARVKEFDVVHLSEVRNYMNTTAASVCCQTGIPYFQSIFGNLAEQRSPHKKMLIYLYDSLWTNKMVRGAEGLLVQNEHEKQACLKYNVLPTRVNFSPLPVHFSDFKVLPPAGLFRKKSGISADAKVILSLGRLHRDKGFQFLLSAFASIPEARKVFLVIVGADESYGDALKKQAADLQITSRVIFPGALYGRVKLEALADADVFALTPLVYEETSLASLEAAACGLPLIVTDRDSVPWLSDYGAGIEIKHDMKELSDTLQLLLLDDKKRKEMGRRARAMIEEKFTVEKVVEEMEKLFADAVNKRQRGH